MSIDNNSSETWKSILKSKDDLATLLDRRIANGISAFFWFDPWLGHQNLVSELGWDTFLAYGARDYRVADILQNRVWDLRRLDMATQLKDKIQYTPIYTGRQIETRAWSKTTNGMFSFSTAWEHVRGSFHEKFWAATIREKCNNPKMEACSYKVNNRLMNKDRLSKWGLNYDTKCVLCDKSGENHEHIFFGFHYNSFLWYKCKSKLKLNNIQNGNIEDEVLY